MSFASSCSGLRAFRGSLLAAVVLTASVFVVPQGLLATESIPLGVVIKDTDQSFNLTFKNTGTAPLILDELKSSCDCLRALTVPTSVAPGETVDIPCVYRSANPGRIDVQLALISPESKAPVATFTVAGFVADPAWMITPAELLAQKDAPTVVVDMRSAERYRQARLPRSTNLALFAVKARTDLRNVPVVLVDEGFSPDVLLAEVGRLRVNGFADVRMLRGGIAAWMRAGGVLEGSLAGRPTQLVRVLSAEFDRARRTARWEMIEARQPDEVLRVVAASSRDAGPLLVVTDDPNLPMKIEAGLGSGASVRPLYYLAGGKPSWTSYQSLQAAVATHTGATFQTKPAAPRAMTSGGCGSCPK